MYAATPEQFSGPLTARLRVAETIDRIVREYVAASAEVDAL